MTQVQVYTVSHETPLVAGSGPSEHALVNAVHLAFSQHRPLRLSPDAIWLTISQGFARHIEENAEALRPAFVPRTTYSFISALKASTTAPHAADVAGVASVRTVRVFFPSWDFSGSTSRGIRLGARSRSHLLRPPLPHRRRPGIGGRVSGEMPPGPSPGRPQ
ncbi:MAG: DUF4419 domain-containing protein [Myxococcota bacterium]